MRASCCLRFAASRATKFAGNFLKLFCYGLHALSPRMRFSIPHHAKALWRRPTRQIIPKTLWQTNYTDRVTLAVYLNYLFNRLMSPTYEYRFMDTAERAAFVANSFAADVVDAYSALAIGAAQADFWRVLVLWQFGGVYLDIDAHLVCPLGFILGPMCRELFLLHKDNKLTNYFLASAAKNPRLRQLIDALVENIQTSNTNDVAELTGPGLLNRVLAPERPPTEYYKYTCYQGSFTNEFFQYLDHPEGKWFRRQTAGGIVRR